MRITENGKRGLGDARGVQSCTLVHLVWMTVVDKHVGQHHGPNLEARFEKSGFGQKLEDMATKSADRSLLHRDQYLVLAREIANELPVERLQVSRVGDRRRHSEACELLRCVQGLGQARAEREDGDRGALAH